MVPDGWKRATIEDLSSLKGGHGFPVTDQGFSPDGIPFIKVSDLNLPGNERVVRTWNNAVPTELAAERGWKTHPADAIVFPKVGAALLTNKRRRLSRPTIIDNNMMAAVPRAGVNSGFLFYLFQTIDFIRYVSPGAVPSVNQSVVGSVDVLSPPFPEQQKISAILSSVDDAIAATRRVIEQTKRVKQGLLQTLMTRGIGHTRFKKTEIGEIPEEWEVARLEDCCEVLDRHRVPLNSEERRERQGDIPYWGANGIVDHIDDYIFDEPLVLIAEDGGYFDQASERPIAQLVEGKIWVNNHAHVLRVTDQVSREWFYFWFVHRDITRFINSGTRSKLNQRDLRQLPIAVPGSDEQDRVVTLLQSVAEGEVVLAREVDCLAQLKRGLMQDLLTGRVRVQPA